LNGLSFSRSGATLAALTAIGGCAPQVAPCGSEPLLAQVQGEIVRRVGQPARQVSNVITIGSDDASARCSLHIAFSDGRESDYSYSLSLQGRETRFEITGSVPTHGPGGVVLDPGAHAP
jgi:hypothetical protein